VLAQRNFLPSFTSVWLQPVIWTAVHNHDGRLRRSIKSLVVACEQSWWSTSVQWHSHYLTNSGTGLAIVLNLQIFLVWVRCGQDLDSIPGLGMGLTQKYYLDVHTAPRCLLWSEHLDSLCSTDNDAIRSLPVPIWRPRITPSRIHTKACAPSMSMGTAITRQRTQPRGGWQRSLASIYSRIWAELPGTGGVPPPHTWRALSCHIRWRPGHLEAVGPGSPWNEDWAAGARYKAGVSMQTGWSWGFILRGRRAGGRRIERRECDVRTSPCSSLFIPDSSPHRTFIILNRISVYEISVSDDKPISFKHMATLRLEESSASVRGFFGNRLYVVHAESRHTWRNTVWDFKADKHASWCLTEFLLDQFSEEVCSALIHCSTHLWHFIE